MKMNQSLKMKKESVLYTLLMKAIFNYFKAVTLIKSKIAKIFKSNI